MKLQVSLFVQNVIRKLTVVELFQKNPNCIKYNKKKQTKKLLKRHKGGICHMNGWLFIINLLKAIQWSKIGPEETHSKPKQRKTKHDIPYICIHFHLIAS